MREAAPPVRELSIPRLHRATSRHVRGWISFSNTNISYPVVVGPYTDYYTHRDVYKNASRNGCIWFDSDTRFDSKGEILSQNAVIYGHNWTNCWRSGIRTT